MQAPKELTLSVLKTLVEFFDERVLNTPARGAERTAADFTLKASPLPPAPCLLQTCPASWLVAGWLLLRNLLRFEIVWEAFWRHFGITGHHFGTTGIILGPLGTTLGSLGTTLRHVRPTYRF